MRLLALLERIVVFIAAATTDVTAELEYVAATDAGCEEIVTAPVLQAVILPLIDDKVVSVAAPDGNALELTVTVHVPDCEAATVPSTVRLAPLSETGTAEVKGFA